MEIPIEVLNFFKRNAFTLIGLPNFCILAVDTQERLVAANDPTWRP